MLAPGSRQRHRRLHAEHAEVRSKHRGPAVNTPHIITGDNYAGQANTLFDSLTRCRVNIFNISKINSEVRGGRHQDRASGIHGRATEYLAARLGPGALMDEATVTVPVKAINELKPILAWLTATPS